MRFHMTLENFSRGAWASLGAGDTLLSKFQRLEAFQA
jgi:hypothetical protein